MGKRRDKGAGSIFQRRDGRWVAQLWDPLANKYQTAYAATEKQAQTKLREMTRRLEAGHTALDTNQTLQVFAEQWIADRAGKRRSPATVYEYASRLRAHVYPVLGKKKIKTITSLDIENMLDVAAKNLASPDSVKAVRNAIAALFTDAVRDRVLISNPARMAQLPLAKPKPRKPIPSTLEIQQLIADGANADTDEAHEAARIVLMAVHTGARIGELLAMKWSEVDLDNGMWKLVATVTRVEKGRAVVGNRTKTGDTRSVALSAEAIATLKHQRDYVAYIRARSAVWGDEDFVFPNSIGTVKDPSNFRHLFKRTYPQWNYTFHSIRSWFISQGLMSGAGLVQVARFVGHKSTRTTTDTYGHLLDEGTLTILKSVKDALGK